MALSSSAPTSPPVSQLLSAIRQQTPGILWKKRCGFTDGQGNTLVEIMWYEHDGKTKIGHVAYLEPHGQVVRYRFQSLGPQTLRAWKGASIVDVLLDIMNGLKG